MTIREVLKIGDPRLREPAQPVPKNQITRPWVQTLIKDLIETMRANDGAGIAAPQIGEPWQIVIMEVNDNPRYPYKPKIPLTIAINPEISPTSSQLVEVNEGCLSVPWRGVVKRNVDIEVAYLDEHGNQHAGPRHGLTAGTWQHECDHLNGVLYVDHADPKTFSTWDNYAEYHQAAFVERITEFVKQIGS